MFAVIDIETTGGQVYEDRITEIAIFKTDGSKIIDSFTTLVNPERKIAPFVVRLTGITDDMVASAPTFKDIASKIDDFTKDCTFVAHNIGFDYSIVKREYKRIGKGFRRSNLCTVKLSQKLIKNENSYSLGKLCSSLGIELNARHRAYGDAEATAKLLHKIIADYGLETIKKQENGALHPIFLNGQLSADMVESLPEEPGIFRFLNKENKVLYLKSAKNIYAEVSAFFTREEGNVESKTLIDKIHSIDAEVINSILISKLQEIEEIQNINPEFCKQAYKRSFPVGIYESKEPDQKSFYVERNPNGNALWRFQTEKGAHRFLKAFINTYNLSIPKLPEDSSYIDLLKKHQQKVDIALSKKLYPYRNFFLVREVPFANTTFIVSVEDFVYQGYAEIDDDFFDNKISSMKEAIIHCDNNPHVQKIMQTYVRKVSKKKNVRILPY